MYAFSRLLLIFPVALLLLPSHSLNAQVSADSLRRIVEHVIGETAAPDHAGTSVALLQDGEIVLHEHYGLANIEHRVPVTDSTVFHVASVSKQFTAYAIARLVAEGRLRLDDPVGRYLEDFPAFPYEITVEHLIYHSSGLREWSASLYLAGRAADDSFTNADVRRLVAAQRDLNFEPGTAFSYTNTNYTLLAEIVEAVTGQTLGEYLDQTVFVPLGMDRTQVREDPATLIPNRAGSYYYRDGVAYDAIDNLAVTGAAGLYSSTGDLALWGRELFEHRLAGDEVYRLLRRKAYLNDGSEIPYAFGFWVGTFHGVDWIDHTGSWAGARAYSTYFPEHRLAIFTLRNYDQRHYLAQHLAAAVLDAHLKPSTAAAPPEMRDSLEIEAAIRPQLTGTYKMKQGYLRLRERGEELIAARFPAAYGDTVYSADYPVVRRSDDGYEVNELGLSFTFDPVGGGLEMDGYQLPKGELAAPSQLGDYTGTYYSDELNAAYEVIAGGDSLRIGNLNNGYFPLRPLLRDEFDVPAGFLDFVSFVRDDSGAVTGLLVSTERSLSQAFRRLPPDTTTSR